MRFVPIKTDDQLDLQAIHRVLDRLVARRTSVINQLRAFLLERGMTFAKTPFKLKVAMPDILENADANLTPRMRNLVSLLWSAVERIFEQQLVGMNQEIEQIASSDPACQRLRQIPGIGPLVATAIVAAIGNRAAFHKGQGVLLLAGTCAAPALDRRQGQTLRHQQARQQLSEEVACARGARSAVLRVKRERSPFGPWLDALERRSPVKVVITAAANKLARVAWAIPIERRRLSPRRQPRCSPEQSAERTSLAWKRRIAFPLYAPRRRLRVSTKVCIG